MPPVKKLYTSDDLAAMLLGLPRDAPRSQIRERLFTQKGIEKNQTAKNIHSSISRIMKELKTDSVLDVYAKHRNGKYPVEEWLEKSGYADSTKNKYYNAMNSVSNPERKATSEIAALVPAEAREHFLNKANRNNDALKRRMDDNVATDKELGVLLPWRDIVDAYEAKRDALEPQQALIADLYVGFADSPAAAPRRLDYNRVRVYSLRKPKNPEKNHIIVNSGTGKAVLHLSEYKTFNRRQEAITAALPKGLAANVIASLGKKPWRKYLLCKLRGSGTGCEAMSAKSLGDQVSGTMEAMTGKAIPVSGIRKSFITWLHGQNLSNARLKEYAHHMGHDVATATLYRKLNIDDSRKLGGGGGGEDGGACYLCGGGDHLYGDCPLRNN
nr:putative zinc knuckle domain-containing protein [Oceanusvirus sp.]